MNRRSGLRVALVAALAGLSAHCGGGGQTSESSSAADTSAVAASSTVSADGSATAIASESPDGRYLVISRDAFAFNCLTAGTTLAGPLRIRKTSAAATTDAEKKSEETSRLVRQLVGEIMATKGMRPESAPPVWEDDSVGQNVASAGILTEDAGPYKKGQQAILYSTEYVRKHVQASGTPKTIVFIFAHELAHLLNGHKLNRPGQHDHDKELEADYFAAFVLGEMGAPLDETTAWIRATTPTQADATHPARQQRLDRAAEGWSKGCDRGKKCTILETIEVK